MFVCSFVRSYFRHVCRICVIVLRQSFSSGVYLSNYLSESIHIRTIVTLEGWHSLYDPRPQGPCPRVGLEGLIINSTQMKKIPYHRFSAKPAHRLSADSVFTHLCNPFVIVNTSQYQLLYALAYLAFNGFV